MSSNELRNDFRPPFAGILQILLATGYNFLSSILELVDNSISKDASNIRILLNDDRICVLDDAIGMDLKHLCDAFVIANVKGSRDTTDIGKFHVGMKSAIMNMGNTIVILTKVVGGVIVGIMVDIEVMKDNNTYNPTEIVPNVTAEWAISHGIRADLFAEFASQDSGTLVHVRHLLPKCSIPYDIARSQLMKGIAISYSNLRPDCKIWIGNNVPGEELSLIDLFYSNDEVIGSPDKPTENLDFAPYETILHVYAPESKNMPPRIVEINTTKRLFTTKLKTVGTPEQPAYYEYSALQKGGQKHSNMRKIEALPTTQLLGVIPIRVIQVKASVDLEENKKVDGSLISDRKGFYFKRGVRTVGVAKRLGKKVHDRTSSAAERQRMLVEFPSELDEVIGSKFNKQMDDQALPSQELTDGLYSIYKQVTGPWTEKTLKLEAAEAARADANSETSEHSIGVMLQRKPKAQDGIPVTNEIVNNRLVENDEQGDDKQGDDKQGDDKQGDEQPEPNILQDFGGSRTIIPKVSGSGSMDAINPTLEEPQAHIAPATNPTLEEPQLHIAPNSPTLEETTDSCILNHRNISIRVPRLDITLLDWLNTLTLAQLSALSIIV